jgi:hypothetical protein
MTLTRYFCPECSTAIYKESDAEGFEGKVILFAGTLDSKAEEVPRPDREFWVSQRVPWVKGVGEGVVECMEFS